MCKQTTCVRPVTRLDLYFIYLSTIDHGNVNYLATYLPTLVLFIIWGRVFVVFKRNELKKIQLKLFFFFFKSSCTCCKNLIFLPLVWRRKQISKVENKKIRLEFYFKNWPPFFFFFLLFWANNNYAWSK